MNGTDVKAPPLQPFMTKFMAIRRVALIRSHIPPVRSTSDLSTTCLSYPG